MSDRAGAIADFVSAAGWEGAAAHPLPGDASARRYTRLVADDGARALLMDAGEGEAASTAAFARLAGFLRKVGLSAPRVLADASGLGLLLVEDLGDALYARVLAATPARAVTLYGAAASALAVLARNPCPEGIEPFDSHTLPPMVAPFFDHYLPAHGATADAARRHAVTEALAEAIARHADPGAAGGRLLLRDCHAENLVWLPRRRGARRAGLLDFQDARQGHPAYDLVSLLEDARRDVDEATRAATLCRFAAETGAAVDGTSAAMAVLGAQRNLRILGLFVRLAREGGKTRYVAFLPRVHAHLSRDLAHPAAAGIARALGPVPDPALRPGHDALRAAAREVSCTPPTP